MKNIISVVILYGGVIASHYASTDERIKGLIFLAAYPDKDLLANQNCLSIYGSNDEILNKERIESNKKYVKGAWNQLIIDGGNHASFGHYGRQKGDGVATITPKEQQYEAIKLIVNFIKK